LSDSSLKTASDTTRPGNSPFWDTRAVFEDTLFSAAKVIALSINTTRLRMKVMAEGIGVSFL